MRTENELNAMAVQARAEELHARDQERLSGEDATKAREFAAGVEAAILWVLGNIGQIPFPEANFVGPEDSGEVLHPMDVADRWDNPDTNDGIEFADESEWANDYDHDEDYDRDADMANAERIARGKN
jgi:hypothetical protein